MLKFLMVNEKSGSLAFLNPVPPARSGEKGCKNGQSAIRFHQPLQTSHDGDGFAKHQGIRKKHYLLSVKYTSHVLGKVK